MNWKNCLVSGLDSHHKGELWQAEQLYVQAIDELERLADQSQWNDALLTVWVSAHHGCAALYQQQGDERMAFRHLMLPHQHLLSLHRKQDDSLDTAAILRQMQQTLPPLLAHASSKPLCSGCRRILTDSQALLDSQQLLH